MDDMRDPRMFCGGVESVSRILFANKGTSSNGNGRPNQAVQYPITDENQKQEGWKKKKKKYSKGV